jgi:hypothetical protein
LDANVFDAPEFARGLRGSIPVVINGGEVAPSAADSPPASARTASPPSPNAR